MPILWTLADLEAELSAETVRQVLDDDNNGTADPNPLLRLQERSCAYVLGELVPVYPALVDLVTSWQSDLTQVTPRLKDIALDYAIAVCAKRHASYVRRDWSKLMKHVEESIVRIRKEGIAGLGTNAPPEPATNQGGTVWAGGDDKTVENEPVFNGPCGMGDFV